MVKLEIKENQLEVDTYLQLRKQVNWRVLSQEQGQKALDHSLYVVSAYLGQECVGMGRIVGDGAVICYVQDLIVVPEAQGQGIGSAILKQLTKYVEELRLENTTMMLCLMSAKGREQFYQHHGFIPRPTTDLGPGMIQFLQENPYK